MVRGAFCCDGETTPKLELLGSLLGAAKRGWLNVLKLNSTRSS